MAKTTTLLIDADILAYRASAAHQETIDWGEDESEDVVCNFSAMRDMIGNAVSAMRDRFPGAEVVMCISDKQNWRKEYFPEYKKNRENIVRPVMLNDCKEWMRETYHSETWPRLEADDVMGILSDTIPDAVIVSADKDMKTVPCRLFNPDKPELGIVQISQLRAFRNHMLQTLTGDSADGYKGCPGIGIVKATAIVDPLLPGEDEVEIVTNQQQLLQQQGKTTWQAIVKTFESRNLTEHDALLQARMAYILQKKSQYNRTSGKIRLWQPPLSS